ncbi:MAG: DUF481 domain-containing protein [Pseudomonadales bacterium]|nr:DUF481 domain-containing protein [Pseudomonadales bacterium]
MRKSFIALLFNLIVCVPGFAINNIENERLAPVKNGLSGQFQASIDGKSGNSEKESFDIGAKGIFKSGPHRALMIASREYGTSFDQTNTDSDFFHFRYVKLHRPSWASEYFVQNQSNPFKRLSQRSLVGYGGRFNLRDKEDVKLILGTGVFFLHEKIAQENAEEFWRANFYFVYKHNLNDQINLLNTLYLQPRMNEFSDLEALNDFSLNIKLSNTINLKLALKTTHDRKPPVGVAKTDYSYRTSFIYSF